MNHLNKRKDDITKKKNIKEQLGVNANQIQTQIMVDQNIMLTRIGTLISLRHLLILKATLKLDRRMLIFLDGILHVRIIF